MSMSFYFYFGYYVWSDMMPKGTTKAFNYHVCGIVMLLLFFFTAFYASLVTVNVAQTGIQVCLYLSNRTEFVNILCKYKCESRIKHASQLGLIINLIDVTEVEEVPSIISTNKIGLT